MNDYYIYTLTAHPAQKSHKAPYPIFDPAYRVQDKEPSIEDFFHTKLQRTGSRIESLIEAIEKRRSIREQNLSSIEHDLAHCQGLLCDMGYKIYSRDQQWAAIETKRLDLYREKRLEESAYFKDLTFLGKELRDHLHYYQSLIDKQSIIGGEG